jgi:DNA-binding IscR family transcriptional regulator
MHSCQLTGLMQRVRDAAAAVLEGCSLADLTRAPRLTTDLDLDLVPTKKTSPVFSI